jgi:outer membrane protein assembly factor BamB
LNPDDGSRRWAIEGASGGTGTPLILDDPENPGEQVIYVGSYDRAMAVKPNADTNLDRIVEPEEMIWEVATGLATIPGERAPHIFGVNYDPTTDALIGLARDNNIYVLDRKSGRSLLAAPYSLPDIAPSPARSAELPKFLRERLEKAAQPILGDMSFEALVGALLGNTSMIANYFSVDPHTGRIWIAATAPDAEDGKVDGVSEFGALYCLKLFPAEDGIYRVEKLFHISFEGGSASTPALSADGERVYVGDNFGKLLAINTSDGSTAWEFDVGEQVVGSVSVASDNGELYLPTATSVVKLIDHGASATKSWHASFDMYPQISGLTENRRSLTATISANGIAVMGASEALLGPGLTLATGVGLLDRETGKLRYFAEGREDSVAVTAVGPDGSVYIAHSPVKRLFASALLGGMVPSITGGVQKYTAKRLDLLIRDAVHAAADRANNVAVNGGSWDRLSKDVEVKQINLLINQCRAASVTAIADRDLTAAQWKTIEAHLDKAESSLAARDFTGAHQALQRADSLL